jgi:hypothetical protein
MTKRVSPRHVSIDDKPDRNRHGKQISFLMGCSLTVLVATSALADSKPPLAPDTPPPVITTSAISASVQFSLSALDRALEKKVPRRLASIDDTGRSCWQRRILGRMIHIDCEYSGYIDRTGPILLRAEDGQLNAAIPLFGTVSGEGIGRFARLLHGTGEGQFTVYATARPRLRPDWSVSLDMKEGFRWREPPILEILGFHIDLTRYIDPRIREQMSRIQRDATASVNAANIRGKAETAWRQAFATVQILDNPPIWLKTTPQAVAFSGTRASGDILEGSLQISGAIETAIGGQPAPSSPTPLPALGNEVSDPGEFAVIIPMTIGYDQIRQKISDALAARTEGGAVGIQDVTIYPSSGKIVAGLHLKPESAGSDGSWLYVTATPQVDAGSQTLQFDFGAIPDAAAPAGSPLATLINDPTLIQNLKQQVQVAFQTEWKNALASASARLTRPLADGFRSEGHLTSADLSRVSLLPEALRIDLRATGTLKIIYGM